MISNSNLPGAEIMLRDTGRLELETGDVEIARAALDVLERTVATASAA